ncbi:MAG: SDR family oxidoreductase [Deltaproteobacteria bacterium]|jgi:short-subunit dehydrogenase|nr:SDR family oxidoreductase [Deltaproteobacteria bacterium]
MVGSSVRISGEHGVKAQKQLQRHELDVHFLLLDVTELSLTVFQNTQETNAMGPLLLSQACLPLMKANNYGRIVNMSADLFLFTTASPLPSVN